MAVIPCGKRLQEICQLLKKNGIVIRRFPSLGFGEVGIRICRWEPYTFAPGLANPVRRCIFRLIAADDTKRQPLSGLDPVLCHRIEDIPPEFPFLRLKVIPQYTQVHNRSSRQRISITRLRVHAVSPKTVGVMIVNQAHTGIYERRARIPHTHRDQTVGVVAAAAKRKRRRRHRQQALQ